MALSFTKKAKPAETDEADTNEAEAPKTTTKPKAAAPSNGGMSFLKTGKQAKDAVQAEEAAAELRKAEYGKLWSFWMPPDEERTITFLDGDLDEDGMLGVTMFHQHTVRMNGSVQNFVCTAEADQTQPCPICEKGDRPRLVGVLTILDHTPHKIKQGANAGKVIQNTKKLFIANSTTMKLLNKQATKRGGLAGCTFEVSRTDEKKPGVGDQFEFVTKYGDLESLAIKYELKEEDVQPANYLEEIVYRTPEQLIELGVTKAAVGFDKSPSKTSGGKSLHDQL